MNTGGVRDYAALAGAGHVSRARISQIMNLTYLAPAIQDALLFLPVIVVGPDRVTEKQVRSIAQVTDWATQMKLYRTLIEASAR